MVSNAPEYAVKVEADTFVAFSDAVPVTFMSPKVAVDALRLTNPPLVLSMEELVIPESSSWTWPLDANPLRAV